MDLHTSSEGLNAGKKLIESISQNSGIRLKATALGKPLVTQSHRGWGIHRRPRLLGFFGAPCLLMALLTHHTTPELGESTYAVV